MDHVRSLKVRKRSTNEGPEKKKRIEARIERSSSSTGSETVAAAADHGVAQMLSFIAQMQTDLAEQATLAKNMSAVRAELRMLQNAAAGPRPVLDPPPERTAGGHPLPILDETDLDAGTQESAAQEQVQKWSAILKNFPSFPMLH